MTTKPPAHYLQAVDELTADPIVQRMAARLSSGPGEQFVNADGTLQYAFMRTSAEEYINAGGQHRGPVGAVGHAMLRLRAEAALTEGDSLS
jgi:molybdopterin-guanine dinucleotide biosynthesis protein A